MSISPKKTSAYLFCLRLLRTGISVITISLAAKFFGISLERDAWILVSAFILTVNLAVWGPINETFRTKFIFMREEEGERIALEKTGDLLFFILLITIGLSFIMYLFPHSLMNIIAPAFGEEQYVMFVKMLYLLIPTFIINQIITIGISILNAYNYFYIPEIVGFFSGIINLVCLVVLVPFVGIYSLVIAQYFSILLLLFVIVYYLKTKHIVIKKIGFKIHWEHIKPFIYFALPFFFPYFVGQCSGLLERSLANSLGDGIVSTLDYSRKFIEILQTVLSSVLISVMVPVLSLHFSKKKYNEFSNDFKQYLQIVFILLSLTLPILIGASDALTKFLFLRGDMSLIAIETIAKVTRFYGIAFISVAIYLLLGLTLLSQGNGKKYALYGISAQVIMIIINLCLYKQFGVYTFAISMCIAHGGVALCMLRSIIVNSKKMIIVAILKYMMILLLAVCTLYGINFVFVEMSPLYVLLISGVSLIFLLVILYELMGFRVLQYLNFFLRRFTNHE